MSVKWLEKMYLFSQSKNPQMAESILPLLMKRAGERRIKQAFSFIDPPHPTLSRWRGIIEGFI